MCTILTLSKAFWHSNRQAVLDRIKDDSLSNSDGFSCLIMGEHSDEDVSLSGMDIDMLLPTIKQIMDDGEEGARLFLHQRFATTSSVGIAYNHGFTDQKGNIIMHNGILSSEASLRHDVDSYELTRLKGDADDLLLSLMFAKETYANVFRIRPADSVYEVLRLSVGTLFTDGQGNYSTNALMAISTPVLHHATNTHDLVRVKYTPPVYDRDGWQNSRTYKFPGKESGAAFPSYSKARAYWEVEGDILAENSKFFVLLEEDSDRLVLYSMEDGSPIYDEEPYRHFTDYTWQATVMIEDAMAGGIYGQGDGTYGI